MVTNGNQMIVSQVPAAVVSNPMAIIETVTISDSDSDANTEDYDVEAALATLTAHTQTRQPL